MRAANGGAVDTGEAVQGLAVPIRNEARPVALSVRLDAETHEALRLIAFERRVSIHSLLLEGVRIVLKQESKA